MKILLFTFISTVHLAVGQNECLPARCGPEEPVVRFPFRLKDHQPENCGFPGFELSCTQSGRTEFDLQFPLTASTNNTVLPLQTTVSVGIIDYKAQKMLANNARARSCPPREVTKLNSSAASPFEVEPLGYSDGFTLFNCSDSRGYDQQVTCLSSKSHEVIVYPSIYDIGGLPPYSSCFKIYNISYVPDNLFTGREDEYGTRFYLRWSRPSCGNCEAQGVYCRLKNGGTAEETECFTPQQPQHDTGASKKHEPLIAGVTAGTIFLMFIVIALGFTLSLMKRKREDQKRIEKILENHKDMRPRRYSYADIKRITNNFKEELSQGANGSLHKGMLVDETPVAVKMLDGSQGNVRDFIDEVDRVGRMQHVNILQLIGYCVDGDKRVLVYELLPGGTFEKLVFSERQSCTLGWKKLDQIALGIARGIDYVHKECTQKILSLSINPQNVLLDHNFNPNVLVFSATAAREATEYIAPELFSTTLETISLKADVYSFGMLMLDIVGRRRNFPGGEKENNKVYFPEWIYTHPGNGEERKIQLEEQEEAEKAIVKKLTVVGLWCIQWFPSDRPSMKEAIQMLEGDNVPVMPPNPFANSKKHK